MILKSGVGLSEDQLNYVINKCDRNKDGFIDYYDFNTLMVGVGESAFETHLLHNGLLKQGTEEKKPKPKKQFPDVPTFKDQIQVGTKQEVNPFPVSKLDYKISSEEVFEQKQVQSVDDQKSDILCEPSQTIVQEKHEVEEQSSPPPHVTESEANISVVPPSPALSSKHTEFSTKVNSKLLAFTVADKLKSLAPSMQKAFKTFSLDKDGTISQKEFYNGLTKMGITISPDEVDSLISGITKDKKLNFSNFSKLVDSSYWGYNKHQKLVDETSPRRSSKEEEIINKRIRAELIENTGMKPIQIRESIRCLDNEKQLSLSPEKFRKALQSINPSLPDWILDRAVRTSELDNGRCDYNKFLRDIGIKLPDDTNMFKHLQQAVPKRDIFRVEDKVDALDLKSLNRVPNDVEVIIDCQTPRKDEQTLEKSMGKKKTILLNSSISDLLENENATSPRMTPKGVRYSSTPPSRNPLFGEESSSSGIKVGYSSKPKEEAVSSKKVFEKDHSLSSGIGSFVNDVPEIHSPRKMLNLQLNSSLDLSGNLPITLPEKKSSKKLYSQRQ